MHMNRHTLLVALLISLCAIALPGQALAAGKAVIQNGSKTTKLAWQDDGTVRIESSESRGYMIIRDGNTYFVTRAGDKPRVMKMGHLFKALGASGQSKKPSLGRIDSVKATGKNVIIAGVEGQVYQITFTKGGKTSVKKVVLTDNALVNEMSYVYIIAMSDMLGIDDFQRFMAPLPEDARGLLSFGDRIRLESITGNASPSGMFELPAEPISMKDMFKKHFKALQGKKQ